MALLKHFQVLGERDLEFRTEAFNLFNHTQFDIYNPDKGNTGSNVISCYGGSTNSAGAGTCVGSSAFLHPVSAHLPRTLQFALKLTF